MMLPMRHNAIKWIAGFCLFMIVFWVVFAEQLLKLSIIKNTEALVGAKVNITQVDISLAPLSLTITEMSVADAQRPMTNIFEFDRALLSIDPYKLLLGHIVIDKLELNKLQLSTTRTESGALKQDNTKTTTVVDKARNSIAGEKVITAKDAVTDKELAIKKDKKSFSFPTVNEVIDKEMGLTNRKISELDVIYKEEMIKINGVKSSLPTPSEIKSLIVQFDKISRSKPGSFNDFKKLKSQLESLHKQSSKMNTDINAGLKQIDDSRKIISSQIKEITSASKYDYQNIIEKYNPNNSPAGNISALLFSDQSKKWLDETIYWYKKIQPLLEGDSSPPKTRVSGRYYQFPIDEPLPRLLIRKVNFEFIQNKSSLTGVIENISSSQKIFGSPIVMKISSNNFFGMTDFNINGVFDHTKKAPATDKLTFKGQGLVMHDVTLSKKPLPLSLSSNNVLIDGNIVIKDGMIASNINSHFNDSTFSSSIQNQRSEILSALNEIKEFTVSAHIDGSWFKPSIGLESDIDKQMVDIISVLMDKKQQQFKTELQKGIKANMVASLSETNDYLNILQKDKRMYEAEMKKLRHTATINIKKAIKTDANKLLKDLKLPFN